MIFNFFYKCLNSNFQIHNFFVVWFLALSNLPQVAEHKQTEINKRKNKNLTNETNLKMLAYFLSRNFICHSNWKCDFLRKTRISFSSKRTLFTSSSSSSQNTPELPKGMVKMHR